ncbi:MAG: hypothetical protein K5837_03885 [Candidatus Saccharibacteria bacterium]|nr:hypothetical protein [Candidatus Saccharibacteria bacterium]
MLDADEEKKIDEEAIAEEEFVADLEDTIENPLVFDGDKITVENKKNESASKPEREELPGAVGSGDLIPEEKPFNNEEALRSENVNNDQNPFSPDSPSEKGFGGPNVAPLEDAAETIAPATAAAEAETVADAPATNPFAGPATKEPDATQGDNSTNSTENSTNAGIFASTEPAAATAVTSGTAESAPTVQDLANDANKPKKKKTGLIIGIVLVILLLGLIGGGIAFYLIHESKERVIGDSIVNLIEANARQFDGTYTQTNLSDDDDSFESFTLTFKGDNSSANFSGSGSLHIDLKEGKDIELEVSGAYISNDAIYVKINGIKKAIDDAMKEGMSSSGGLSSDEEMAFIMEIIGSVVKPLDDQWIKINASSLKSYASLKSGYDCMSNAIDGFAKEENKEKIVEAYKNHPFVMDADKDSKSSDGLNYYYIKSDSEESKAFSEEIGKIDFVKDFKSCANIKSSEDDDDDELDLTSELSIGISPWAHELKHIKGTAKSKEYSAEMNIKISYDDKSVAAPSSDAKTLDELAKDLSKSIKDALSKQIATMCKEYKAYGESVYNYCVEQYTKELGEEFNFENLINSSQGMIKTSI